jgi:hypothetical protein
MEEEALYLPVGEPGSSENAILDEGAEEQTEAQDTQLIVSSQIVFVFILILFIDSVNRVYRVQVELAAAGKEGKGGA